MIYILIMFSGIASAAQIQGNKPFCVYDDGKKLCYFDTFKQCEIAKKLTEKTNTYCIRK